MSVPVAVPSAAWRKQPINMDKKFYETPEFRVITPQAPEPFCASVNAPMKKASILTVLALGAAVLAVSCQKKAIEQEPAALDSRTFKCVIASPDTKVAVSDAGKATWEVGDEILVHGEGSSNRKVVTLSAGDISADGKTATITVEGIEPYDRSNKGYTSTLYACYPASASVSGNLYYYARFSETNHLLMAAYNVEDTFVFYNLCGVISFTVSGDFDSYVFSGNQEETVGYSHYQVQLAATDGDPDLRFNKDSDPGTSGPLTSLSGNVVADGKTVNYIGIPTGADFMKGFTFKFKKGGVIKKIASTATAVNVARNKLLPLGDITSRLETYVPPAVSDHKSAIPTKNAVDLSANGTANSYIISSPGIYKFPAMKGNSKVSAGNVFDAALLWETYNNSEEVTKNSVVKAVDFEDNWIYLEMPATLTPGNALIAAKDVNDKIIWSWHIWVPASAITTNQYALAITPLMDRNLGALVPATAASSVVDVQSLGLAYEWGRKDPFPGPKAMQSGSPSTVAGQAPAIGRTAISIEESIAAPTTFVTVDNASWSVETDTDLWTVDGAKNIYDPCPPGYKVPTRKEAPSFFVADLSTIEGWATDGTNYWFTLGNPAAVFPMGGYIDDCNDSYAFTHVYDRVAVWSADAGSAKGGYAVDVRLGSRQQVSSPARSRGGYVRCIVEGGSVEPFQNAEGMPVMGSYKKMTVPDAIELSGLCLSADKSFLWGVGDGGTLYQIGFDGTVTTVWTHSADMEGITLHPTTGDLYIAVEGEQKVYKVPVPDYSKYSTIFYVQEAVDGSYGNSGLEGITYYKNDMLYVGSQYGATLWTYKLDGTKVGKKLLTTLAPGIEEVGGLFYDPETDWLWVTDSEAKMLFVFEGDVSKLLAIYDISFISNAESVCVDHAHSCVWVGSDDSTSKLFKIDFT